MVKFFVLYYGVIIFIPIVLMFLYYCKEKSLVEAVKLILFASLFLYLSGIIGMFFLFLLPYLNIWLWLLVVFLLQIKIIKPLVSLYESVQTVRGIWAYVLYTIKTLFFLHILIYGFLNFSLIIHGIFTGDLFKNF